jgi:hypothetical protein
LQAVPGLLGDRFERAAGVLANGPAKIFVEGIERVRPYLGEGSSKRSFNAVDGMKEVSAVHFELPGAELPIGTQEEVIPEEPMIFVIEHAPAYETEVGHVFFLLPGIDATPARAGAEFPGNRSEGRLCGGAVPETAEAGPKNGPKDAIAWRCLRLVDNARPVAFAILARFSRQPNRIRSIPLHFENVLLDADFRSCPLTMDSTAFSNLVLQRKTSMNSKDKVINNGSTEPNVLDLCRLYSTNICLFI